MARWPLVPKASWERDEMRVAFIPKPFKIPIIIHYSAAPGASLRCVCHLFKGKLDNWVKSM